MVTDLEPPQTGFTISMLLIEKKQQVILFSRQKLLHKNRGSLNSLWLGSQQAAILDTLAGTFTSSSASLNWQLSTLNWGEGWKKKTQTLFGRSIPIYYVRSGDHCHDYLIRQSVFLWNVPMKLSVFENQHTYVTI